MKLRSGFVSNSSTTSFCIFGISFEDEEELFKRIKPEMKEKCGITEAEDCSADLEYESDTELEFHSDQEGEPYIGLSCTKIGMDETRREFEARVKKGLKELFEDVSDGEVCNYDASYFNG